VSVATKEFGIGQYWTAEGRVAMVDAVVDGKLLGRVNIGKDGDTLWFAAMWNPDGSDLYNDRWRQLTTTKPLRISQHYWVNVYPSGVGQLRETWEQCLIESSRCKEEQPLMRVRVFVDGKVGDGLK